ncbi:MAG: tRNA uridine-5-carboxymethylaminomethyl(34) synthesis GTPase MnmE [Lachnospiraceae bacterium]|nr:tRNA uridine-5-carboxymethylaminomethyl(34) synthesis GTPase MnmE [Lachnospiraceae bacterium]
MFMEDTIAAISTAMSDGGIGIIRISGPDAVKIGNQVFQPANKNKSLDKMPTYTAAYGKIHKDGKIIDECIALFMKGPKSYTGEDVVEIDCHGGVVVVKKVLETIIEAGARPAEPGEFTKRAFFNGRIDLSQAEAVMDLIYSKNEFAMESSLKQLSGSLKNKINSIRDKILYEIAFIESALDDPEHISLDGYSDKLYEVVKEQKAEIDGLLSTADNGRILKEGIKTAIVGKPNAGKSSLLNLLVGEERAIVTDIAGTTRDTLEESILIKGIPLQMIDTAGIRKTDDIVEKIGIEKAKNAIEKADLVLYVADSSSNLDDSDFEIMDYLKEKKTIIILNKSDLDKVVGEEEIKEYLHKDVITFSAKEETGLDELYEKLESLFFEGKLNFNDEIYITNMRHKNSLKQASDSLNMVFGSIEMGMPEDFFSIDLTDAYEHLGYILGESMGEDLVNKIFSEFCMGK